MKKIAALALLLLGWVFPLIADDITGFWQTINKETKLPNSVIAVYAYQGKYYGRIVATYNEKGEIAETMDHPVSRAPGVVGEPYYCGLDIVLDAEPEGNGTYKGRVIDPRAGKSYRAELWRRNQDLVLRGEMFIFGKNVTWPPFPEEDFNSKFKKPDVSKFVPKVPHLKG
jgi:uncharacterized protein (DUF2147 family)